MFQRKQQTNLSENHRIIDAKNVWKRYETGGHKIEALRGKLVVNGAMTSATPWTAATVAPPKLRSR